MMVIVTACVIVSVLFTGDFSSVGEYQSDNDKILARSP
tara:strand:+ start:504 stop:617 length:114 start_codon:yes stop_codon:yes gene_type:complete